LSVVDPHLALEDPLVTRNVDEMNLAAGEHYRVFSVVISHDMASVFRTSDRIDVHELLRANGRSEIGTLAGGQL
jgi:ABC-type transporter Mla maintaining outer membrane lipid asymmetry ATPase subunit MlaF